jgi:cbb3-type cytochrome oxidase maturation protein
MEILFVLIPLSLGLVAFALWSFVWSVKNEQFEDLDRQGWSILFDDQDAKDKPDKRGEQQTQAAYDYKSGKKTGEQP